MYRKIIIPHTELSHRLAGPPIEKFKFKRPELKPFEEWGWCSFLELNRSVLYEIREAGHIISNGYRVFYQSFFPHQRHWQVGKEKVFTWIIVKHDEPHSLEQGDMMFCPFPSQTDHRVCRTEVHLGEHLYLPARWCDAVLNFVRMGFIDLECRAVEVNTGGLPFEYFGVTVGGKVERLTIATGLAFGP